MYVLCNIVKLNSNMYDNIGPDPFHNFPFWLFSETDKE